ncbi:toxin-antitoxin system YwqK family antitoxin [uncultured Hymenobacter sp.]|uniref:toxin-antitoxin system YwqK family antitoxin n=1 Tax=uncultured Hymenobacter sp. TaxID=170016 RepID=UPI0035C98537
MRFPFRHFPAPVFLLLSLTLLALAPAACTRKAVSFNSRPESVVTTASPRDTLTITADSLRKGPSLSTARKQLALSKSEERAAKEKEKETQRKPRKKKKVFLGERIKRAYVKSGGSGRSQVIEIFYYLRTFQQPNPYAPARYYYDGKKRRIYKATRELDPATDKILHGPYKKVQNNQTIETGFFALGTRHLRWEKFGRDGVLLSKTHYEQGYPRDANISYYDAGRTLPQEVVPYVNGKLEGDYARFLANGQRDWSGEFENGHRVGTWTKYWGFRNRRHYEYQYAESGFDPEVAEPELVREYNRNGTLIFDKEKGLDKRGQPEAEDRPGQRRPAGRGK